VLSCLASMIVRGARWVAVTAIAAATVACASVLPYPTFVDERAWGEQFLLVLREGSDGWRFDQAGARELCTTAIDHEECA
jgi:hypothetical protein